MADITSNLVAWYKLDETSGTSAADSSGNGYTGTYTNSPTLGVEGAFSGSRATLLSQASYQKITTSLSLNALTNATFSCWVKPTSYPGSYNTVIGGDAIFGIELFTVGGKISAYVGGFVDGTTSIQTNIPVTPGVWTHLVLVKNGTTCTLYKNGVSIKSQVLSGASLAAAENLHIGWRASSDYFNGAVDDVRVYSRALSAGDVAALYAWQPTVVSNSRLVNSGGFNRNTFSALVNN